MMKKITLLFAFCTVFLGYSQNFPLTFTPANEAMTGFDGLVASITTDPQDSGNDVQQLTGTPNLAQSCWDNAQLNFGAAIDLSSADAADRTITFRVQTTTGSADVRDLGLQFAGASSGGNLDVRFQLDLTTGGGVNTWYNMSVVVPLQAGRTFATFVIFSDMQLENGTCNGIINTYLFDDFAGGLLAGPTCSDGIQNGNETGVDCGGDCDACPTPPATAAPAAPARAAADVLSIFSGEYTDVINSGLGVFAGASFSNVTIVAADDTKRLTAPNNGGGAQYEFFNSSPALDLTGFTHAHVDFYVSGTVPVGSVFNMSLLNFPNYPSGDGNTSLSTSFDVNALGGSGTWIIGDIELSAFGGNLTRDKIALVQIVAAGPAGSTYGPVYIDNIYFHKNTTLATKNFEIAGLNVYPNPARDSWTVKTQNINMSSIQVFDVLGKNVLSLKPNASEATINGSSLKSGLYFARINTLNGSSSLKLIKN
jgi:hypothetical protein